MPDRRSFEERVFARFDALDAWLGRMDARLNDTGMRLEKLEAKSYDTKPVWERALAEIAETRNELQTGLRRVERKIDVLNQNILEVRADLRDLDTRVEKLESHQEKPL